MDFNNVAKALEEKYSTNVTPIYIPSRKKTADFRSIKVGEQKTITKIMLDSDGDQYKIYQAMLGLVQATVLEDDFNIGTLTELDRLKILIDLYSGNFFNNEVAMKCEKCGTTNKVSIDFDEISKTLGAVDATPKTVTIDDVVFTIGFPNVVRMGKYYKSLDSGKRTIGDMCDMYDQFILTANFDDMDVDFETMSIKQVSQILCIFPQHILYGEGGLVEVITTQLLSVLSNMSDESKCKKCEGVLTGGLNIQDFFT